MTKRSKKVQQERIEKRERLKWEKKTFVISTLVTIFCSIFSAMLGFIGGKATTNNYYGDVITYQVYGEAIANNEMTESETKEVYNISTGKSIAIFATEYCVGKPYVWGGASLKEGADASGLVISVYKKYGIDLPHSSYAIAELGEEVNFAEIRDGDIVCYDGHVGIYVGENMVVHASNPRNGVVLENMYYREPITIRRFDFAEAQGDENE
uniref:C40 family peptidase n=1 Tax=Acetatifactor sp. TaxID=1872090 RepID=UPI0040573C4D